MISVHVDVVVPASVDDVFQRLVDLPAYDEWLDASSASTECRVTSSGPVGEGTTYEDHGVLGTFDGVILEFVRPTRVVFHQSLSKAGRSILRATQTNVLAVTPDGTRVDHELEASMLGASRVLTPAMRIGMRRERVGVLRALVRSFES